MAAEQLYTPGSLLTFGGASSIVLVITKVLAAVAPVPPAPVAFGVSLLVSIGGALQAQLHVDFVGCIVIAGNACLLFLTATGANEAILKRSKPREGGPGPGEAVQHARPLRKPSGFRDSWFT